MSAVLLATDTRTTVHGWRHRNDPPRPKAPPPAFRDPARRDIPPGP